MSTLIAYRISRAQAALEKQGGPLPLLRESPDALPDASEFVLNAYELMKLPQEEASLIIKDTCARMRAAYPSDPTWRDRAFGSKRPERESA